MRRIVIRIVNLALVVACAFQTARVINLIAADLLTPAPVYQASGEVHQEVARSDWGARKTILDRNLFGAKLVDDAPPEPVAIEEDVEETKLPLILEATIAGSSPSDSRAAIQDTRSRTSMVLAVGDTLETHSSVRIAAIERGRVLLNNKGRHEELLLNEDAVVATSGRSPSASRSSTSSSNPKERSTRRARRPSSRSQRSARETVERLRQESAENPDNELTLEEITAEIERMRDLEAR